MSALTGATVKLHTRKVLQTVQNPAADVANIYSCLFRNSKRDNGFGENCPVGPHVAIVLVGCTIHVTPPDGPRRRAVILYQSGESFT